MEQNVIYASKPQVMAINAILAKKRLLEQKASIIAGLTNGRTEHSSKLLFVEAAALLKELNGATADPCAKMRNHIIAMAHEMDWIVKITKIGTSGKIVSANDYKQLDNWMLKHSYLKKCLFDYSYKELPKLVTQFKNVYNHYLKR